MHACISSDIYFSVFIEMASAVNFVILILFSLYIRISNKKFNRVDVLNTFSEITCGISLCSPKIASFHRSCASNDRRKSSATNITKR